MIEVSVARDGLDDGEPPSSSWVEDIVKGTLELVGIVENCEVSVLLTNDEKIQELNRDYRQKDSATDVLSFAFEEGEALSLPPGAPRVLGDVVCSMETIERQATAHQKTVPQECAWALCHGVLHLCGYDHETDEQEREMRDLEVRALDLFSGKLDSW